ncbi:MAG: DUF2607 family protein [Vibrio sp.]
MRLPFLPNLAKYLTISLILLSTWFGYASAVHDYELNEGIHAEHQCELFACLKQGVLPSLHLPFIPQLTQSNITFELVIWLKSLAPAPIARAPPALLS